MILEEEIPIKLSVAIKRIIQLIFYIKNKGSLSDLRKKTLDWWISYKENLKTKAYDTYEEVF